MYQEHFKLREAPFSLTPDPDYFYNYTGHQQALNVLLVALQSGEGLIKITGEVGTGKTLLCRKLLAALAGDFQAAYLPNPLLTPFELYHLDEVEHLVDYGFREIELLGQTVNHWREPGSGDAGPDFADLLERVASVPGVERLRFVTSYPRDFTPNMVEQFAKHSNISPYLHLPVQSASNSVLQRMGRGYTIESYYELVASLRQARSGIALSTDLIVGFPGETDDEFERTFEMVSELEFASLFAFKYSPRPGTAAPRLGEPVEPTIADERLQRIFAAQEPIQRRLNQDLVGSRSEVLVTGWGKRPGTQSGRTPCHRVVHFPIEGHSPVASGDMIEVEIEEALAHSLLGRRLDSASQASPSSSSARENVSPRLSIIG